MAYPDLETELEAERANGDRVHAALATALAMLRDDERESLRAILICPRISQLTVGHVIDGALLLHEQTSDRRVYC